MLKNPYLKDIKDESTNLKNGTPEKFKYKCLSS